MDTASVAAFDSCSGLHAGVSVEVRGPMLLPYLEVEHDDSESCSTVQDERCKVRNVEKQSKLFFLHR